MSVDIAKARAIFKANSVKTLREVGEFILKESNQIAPFEDGELINSGRVVVDEENLSVQISYNTPYALVQHEDLELHHTNGRRARFLTSAAKDNQRRIREYLESGVKGGD